MVLHKQFSGVRKKISTLVLRPCIWHNGCYVYINLFSYLIERQNSYLYLQTKMVLHKCEMGLSCVITVKTEK
jgi:hypothetical protein